MAGRGRDMSTPRFPRLGQKMNNSPQIPFIDLQAQRARLADAIDEAVLRVIHHGAYILGPEVSELETTLAEFSGVADCVSCGSGTDALLLYLMAKGIKAGDAVFVPAFTFVATAEAVALLGATPVFVDVHADDFNMDPASLQAALELVRSIGLRPVGVIPVDLFGQPADYPKLEKIAANAGMWVLSDGAQSYGAQRGNVRVGAFGEATATSFFPAKPLGCYGDGGAVFTDNPELGDLMRSFRVHGQGEDKYTNIHIGMNGRMDTVQAAVLLEKLRIFPEELVARQNVADRYSDGLADLVSVPKLAANTTSAWAQYTLKLDGGKEQRERVQSVCSQRGVPTAVYYPTPLNRQTAYSTFPSAPGGLPISEALSQCVISLPMHPYLEETTQDFIIETVREALLV